MSVKDVKTGTAHIDASFVVIFLKSVFCVMVRICGREYGSTAPWVPSGRVA
jgi:hypothetical protein